MKNLNIRYLCVLCVLLPPFPLKSEINRINLRGQYPVLRVENQVWLGTPTGLYRYNPDDETFKRYLIPTKSQNVRRLYYNDEWLWCVSDSGLAVLHVRLNEWLLYDIHNGLPSNMINGLTFQEDYVWIATDSGAARFDLLIEEWEIYDSARGLPALLVNDILVTDEQVWLIGNKEFSEYDPGFEKWRYYRVDDDPTVVLKRVFLSGEEIWLICNKGLIRFNPQLRTRQHFFQAYLKEANLIEIIAEDNRLWAITRSGLFFYEQNSGVWREFEGNSYLTTSLLINGTVNTQQVWVLTDQKVLVWDRQQKNWEILDYASGLSASRFESVYSDGEADFLFKSNAIDYRSQPQQSWRIFKIQPETGKPGLTGRRILKNLFDNESGGYVPLGKYRWGFEGSRITWLRDYQQQADQPAIITSGERLDVKSQLSLGPARSVTGFYNNIDYSETMYGVRYKSRKDELLQEVNWGDFRRTPGKIPFAETASLFGSNVWLQAGPKTERFKRSRFTLKAHTGELRSRKTYEAYQGAGDNFQHTCRDIDYLENQFYTIPGPDSLNMPEEIEIYIDDLNSSNNTLNTLSRHTIAGVSGDFDLWKAAEDYYFYEKKLLIRFLKMVKAEWTIVIRFKLRGQMFESILQYDDVVSSVCRNVYYLEGQKIVPYSFHLEILDSQGAIVPLENFQLDRDGDQRIDSRWLDYENGLLFFPDPEPFPLSVYDPTQPESFYHFDINFQTEFSMIQLEFKNLVRGSESLRLDGNIAAGGNDYVLDYTNGALIFVREGVVNTDTRIEIEYEYYTSETGNIHSAALNWSPSDNFYLQSDWLQINSATSCNGIAQQHKKFATKKEPQRKNYLNFLQKKQEFNSLQNSAETDGAENDSTTNLFSVHSEIRRTFGGVDARIIPGLAYIPGENQLAAGSFETLISSSKFRLKGLVQNFSKRYRNLYRPQSVFGEIHSRRQIQATADLLSYLRLSGEQTKNQGYAQPKSNSPFDETNTIGFLFHRQGWPGWQFSYHKFKTHSQGEVSEKSFVQNRWEYQLSESLSRKIFLKRLRTEAFLRAGEQSGHELYGSMKQKFRQGYIRLNTQLSERFQGNLFYRQNDLRDNSQVDHDSRISRSERLLFDLSHEEWQLLQLNVRTENFLNQHFHRNSSLKNANMRQFSQFNLRLSPGRVWKALSALYFEFNYNQSLSGWGTPDAPVKAWLWRLIGPDPRGMENIQRVRSYYFKNEIRPGANLLIYSLLELNRQQQGLSGSRLKNRYYRWNEKVDLKLGFKTRVIIQYRQYCQNSGYGRAYRYFEPSTWLEHRWTPGFQNNLNFLYRRRQTDEGWLRDESHHWEGRCDLIWRKYRFYGIRRLEVRQSFSGIYHRSTGSLPARNWQLASGSSLDVYPLHSMIIRLRLDLNQFLDELLPEDDYGSKRFNIKISLRF